MGHIFLVIVNAHSKWLDAHIMSSITSAKTIEILRTVFATHGLPKMDNGSSFTSEEFKKFVRRNRIKHVTSAPYHPSTNGQAERAVLTDSETRYQTYFQRQYPGKTHEVDCRGQWFLIHK